MNTNLLADQTLEQLERLFYSLITTDHVMRQKRQCLVCSENYHSEDCVYDRGSALLWRSQHKDHGSKRQAMLELLCEIGRLNPMRTQHPWYPYHDIRVCAFCESTEQEREHVLGCPWLLARAYAGLPTSLDRRALLLLPIEIKGGFIHTITESNDELTLEIDVIGAEIPERYCVGNSIIVCLRQMKSLSCDFPLSGLEYQRRMTREGIEISNYMILPVEGPEITGMELATTWGRLKVIAREIQAAATTRK